jgi:hypothetical protein
MSEHRTRPRGTGGRKSMGERVPCTVRFAPDLYAEIMRGVDEAGYKTMQEFLVDLVVAAQAAGLFPAAAPGQEQERLPISA